MCKVSFHWVLGANINISYSRGEKQSENYKYPSFYFSIFSVYIQILRVSKK